MSDLGKAYVKRLLVKGCQPGGTYDLDSYSANINGEEVNLELPLKYQASTWALDLKTMSGQEYSLNDHYQHWDPDGDGDRRTLGDTSGEAPIYLVGYDHKDGAIYLYRETYDEATNEFDAGWQRLDADGEPTEHKVTSPEPMLAALWQGRLINFNGQIHIH